jgi:hypothetical protein
MTNQTSHPLSNQWHVPILAVVCFVALIQGAWWILGDQIAVHGGFVDGDSYTRLLRVERLVETRDWFDISIPDANAPYGTTVHWTRLFDLVLLIVSAPLVPVLGFSKALYWAGTIVSPILHILTAATLVWALTPLVGRLAACFAGGLSAAQIGVMVFGIVGRADHHMMFVLFITLSFGFMIRAMLTSDQTRRTGWLTGLTIAAGIWVGPEFVLYMAISFTVLGFQWLFEPTDRNLKLNQITGSGLVTGLVIAVIIERGFSGLMEVEYDRISLVHISLGMAILVFWATLAILKNSISNMSILLRSVLCICGLTICAAVLFYYFPKLMGNPLNDADPAIQPIYTHISEYKPITDWGRFLIYYGSGLLAVPWLIWRLKQTMQKPEIWGWVFIALCLTVYLLLGYNWIRWCLYAGLFLSIIIADAIFNLDRFISNSFVFPKRLFLKVLTLPAIATGPMILGALLLYADKTPQERFAEKNISCPIIELSKFLDSHPTNARSQTIIASANFGPELIYRTNHRVLATVHHRNVSGILDGHTVLQAVDDAIALQIIKERGVNLILLCLDSGDDKYFLTNSKPGALYKRLATGQIPVWLTGIPLVENLGNKFKLFEIQSPEQTN